MIVNVRFPDGDAIDVEVDDALFERAQAACESKGQTFEESFLVYLKEFLDQHPIIAQGKAPQ